MPLLSVLFPFENPRFQRAETLVRREMAGAVSGIDSVLLMQTRLHPIPSPHKAALTALYNIHLTENHFIPRVRAAFAHRAVAEIPPQRPKTLRFSFAASARPPERRKPRLQIYIFQRATKHSNYHWILKHRYGTHLTMGLPGSGGDEPGRNHLMGGIHV
ncbi:hypothetical protein JI664_08935 [Rhodobacter sp. NTK016B]|uniref:hypothetical protein n=1 Tax=Rhodobacter sp. NTK016B TaxID=2759676 RepID=UPI001A8F96A3|nr:hypothetical protein [Rhodobacter sp. NTK016B]MBN8292086.1 hypothetical protein [Rhodobacter sp. NTK016B]